MDCLIIGMNDGDFENYVDMIELMGKDSGAFQDINLAFIEYNGKKYRALDIFTHFHNSNEKEERKTFHNLDFLWPTITYLGNYLHKRGYIFDYVNLFHMEKDKLKAKLIKDNILTIAIATTLYVSPIPILEIVAYVKKYNSDTKIIIGGPFVYNQMKLNNHKSIQSLFKFIGADFYVNSSEGESALIKIIEALKNGFKFNEIDNIIYKKDEEYIATKESKEMNPIEENCVDYNLFPKKDIGEFLSIRTAKSCPFNCAFCGFPKRSDKYQYLSVEMVEKQLDRIRELDTVTTLTIIDDTFNVPRDRFKEILLMMINNKYNFKWNCYYRCDHGNEEIIELMKKAGCEGVFLGVESGSDKILERMNKTVRKKDYMKYIPLLKQAGILTRANFIVGFPGETPESVKESMELIEETSPDFYRAQLWYCDPITPIWDKREKYGIKGKSFNWSHNTMDNKAAIDLVGNMFRSIKNSIWLPQFGFEIWSVYYLQRKGMSLEQIKVFIKNFNSLIKMKLNNNNQYNLRNTDLFENLKRSCQFNN